MSTVSRGGTHCLEQERFCGVFFHLFCPRGRKNPKSVTSMLCGEEHVENGAKALCGNEVTLVQTTHFFPKSRQIAM